jgi:hypothetical protein
MIGRDLSSLESFMITNFSKSLVVAGFASLISLAASAAEKATAYSGYLIDRTCEASITHAKGDPLPALKLHSRDCALEPTCSEAGYALYSNGRFIDFDSKGNQIVHKYYEGTKLESGHYVVVVGSLKGNLLSPDTIKETTAPASK